jgi:hypothetical protein
MRGRSRWESNSPGFAPSFGSRVLPAPFRARKKLRVRLRHRNNAGAAAGVRSNASYTTRLALIGEVGGQSAAADEFRGGARCRAATRRRQCSQAALRLSGGGLVQEAGGGRSRPLAHQFAEQEFRHRSTASLATSAAGQSPALACPHAGPFAPVTKRPRRGVRTPGGA